MSAATAPELMEQMSKPVRRNPVLHTVNGIGFGFAGTALRHPDLGGDLFVRMHWFKVVFIPILPLGIYLLSNPVDDKGRSRGGSYHIHRAVQIRCVNAIWGAGDFWGMLLSAWGIAIAVVVVAVLAVAIVGGLSSMG